MYVVVMHPQRYAALAQPGQSAPGAPGARASVTNAHSRLDPVRGGQLGGHLGLKGRLAGGVGQQCGVTERGQRPDDLVDPGSDGPGQGDELSGVVARTHRSLRLRLELHEQGVHQPQPLGSRAPVAQGVLHDPGQMSGQDGGRLLVVHLLEPRFEVGQSRQAVEQLRGPQ